MPINIDKLKEKLEEFDRKRQQECQNMLNYTTSLFIGGKESRIRTWLDNVHDELSLVALNGAIDSFLKKVSESGEFSFQIKRSPTNGNDIIDVRGKLISWELFDVHSNAVDKTSVHIVLQLGSIIAQPSLEYELKTMCYFFLNGSIEGHTNTGRKYNATQDTFDDHTENIIETIDFSTFSMWCDRRRMTHELYSKIPF